MLRKVYWSKLNDSRDKITIKAGFRKEKVTSFMNLMNSQLKLGREMAGWSGISRGAIKTKAATIRGASIYTIAVKIIIITQQFETNLDN